MLASSPRSRSDHGWSFVDEARKREIVDAICRGDTSAGPVHAELDLTDRCNVACYFCNQMDVRTKAALPFEDLERLVDELVAGGLRSVRLSGGGDPLMYPDFPRVQDLFAERGVTIDNLTTNAARLVPEIAERLVARGAREVVVSLNAVDARDYQRMMQVAPKVFDAACANVRRLAEIRGDAPAPAITVKFLIDRENYRRLGEMYELGRALGADRVSVSAVLDIPRERLLGRPLLWAGDHALVRPYLRSILEADREAGLLLLDFPWDPWNRMIDELRRTLGAAPTAGAMPAPAGSFRPDLDHCFFGWYSVAIRGPGEMYPCCMLMNPDYEPLGDLRRGSFSEQWQGDGFTRLRREMRETFLRSGRLDSSRLKALTPQCVETGRCGLKSMFFRHDEAFYRELGEAVDAARRRELRWLGSWRGAGQRLRRSLAIFGYRLHWGIWERRTRALQAWERLRRRRFPGTVRRARLHVGTRARLAQGSLVGWILLDGSRGEGSGPWADRALRPAQPLPFREVWAIHAERVLENLAEDEAQAFLRHAREALTESGVLRVAALNQEWVTAHGGAPAGEPLPANLWPRERLESELQSAGFGVIEWQSYGRSRHLHLRNLEDQPVGEDTAELPCTLVVEATRGPAVTEPAAGSPRNDLA